MDSHNTIGNWVINGVSIAAIFTSLLGFVPAFAALIAAGYYAVQIWESETVRRWRAGRRAKKIAALRAELLLLEAHDLAAPVPSKTSHD